MTVNELLARNVERHPERVYVYFRDQALTYGEFDLMTNKVANGLLKLGVQKGNKVSIMLPNSLEFLYTLFGCFKIGAVMVPVNLAFSAEEVEYVVNHSEAMVLVTDGQYLSTVNKVRAKLKLLKTIVVVTDEMADRTVYLFSNIIKEQSAERPKIEVQGEDEISMIYTSGTTGKPKGVVLTHNAYASAARAWNESIGIKTHDLPMSVLSLRVYRFISQDGKDDSSKTHLEATEKGPYGWML